VLLAIHSFRQARPLTPSRFKGMKGAALAWIAVLLVVLWIVARFVLAMANIALNLLWIVAIVVAVIWLIAKFKR
jgi:predicted lipid-binding transport protein (Tim44 family)